MISLAYKQTLSLTTRLRDSKFLVNSIQLSKSIKLAILKCLNKTTKYSCFIKCDELLAQLEDRQLLQKKSVAWN